VVECGESGGDSRPRPGRPASAPVPAQTARATPAGARRRPAAAGDSGRRARTASTNTPSRS